MKIIHLKQQHLYMLMFECSSMLTVYRSLEKDKVHLSDPFCSLQPLSCWVMPNSTRHVVPTQPGKQCRSLLMGKGVLTLHFRSAAFQEMHRWQR